MEGGGIAKGLEQVTAGGEEYEPAVEENGGIAEWRGGRGRGEIEEGLELDTAVKEEQETAVDEKTRRYANRRGAFCGTSGGEERDEECLGVVSRGGRRSRDQAGKWAWVC